MNLWIRSQDKEYLGEVSKLFYSYDEIDDKHLIRTFVIDNLRNGIIQLGTYKTKERALEVLDEIQRLLFPVENIQTLERLYAHLDVTTKYYNFVYEMPQE